MEAGKELDVKVATAIGWENIYLSQYNGGYYGKPPGGFYQQCTNHRLPLFSKKISAAWKIVEKLEHLHPNLSYCDTTCTWTVSLWKAGEHKSVTADTAPLAICLAALKATENAHNPL